MQVGATTNAAESLVLLQGSSANQSEQANRQVLQQQETVLQENRQQTVAQPSGNIGQNIDTTVWFVIAYNILLADRVAIV